LLSHTPEPVKDEGITMCRVFIVAMIAALACGSVHAQTPTQHQTPTQQSQQSSQKPVDHGPFTPEASSAYQGGGVILQGAPGAPPPSPQPTAPGQSPANMVKP
jgi:hypothetical protein